MKLFWVTFLLLLDFRKGKGSENNRCARTSVTEVDHQPWWQIDLGRDYVVEGIDITFGDRDDESPSYFLGTSSNGIEFNNFCDYSNYAQHPPEPRTVSVYCNEPVIGRFFIIKKLSSCANKNSCPLTSLPLTLCEVKINGFSYEYDPKLARNIALGSSVMKSGSLKNGSLLVDGITTSDYVPQCAIITNYEVPPDWSVYLNALHKIDRVVVYSNESIENLILESNEVECPPLKLEEDSDGMIFVCDEKKVTNWVTVRLKHPGSFALCEVEIFTSEGNNVALGKPTNQSSVEYEAGSHIAVDGYKGLNFYTYVEKLIPQCTHTAESGEEYPWWRVDLLGQHIISSIHIYNRGETLASRLHDLEIRIGDIDIAHYDVGGKMRFNVNSLCFSLPNGYLNGGKSVIRCDQEMIGRYVSIQIVKLCTLADCQWSSPARNILTLCEVEVFGIAIKKELLSEKNLGSYGSAQLSLDSESVSERFSSEIALIPDDEAYDLPRGQLTYLPDVNPWLLLDLGSKNIVTKIILKLDTDEEGYSPNFDIRVGNQKINFRYNNKLFKKNIFCDQVRSRFLEETNQFNCVHPLVGRYVSLQVIDLCTTNICVENVIRFLSMETEVWGYLYKDVAYFKNIASQGFIYSLGTHIGALNLAVDGLVPESIFSTIDSCAKTDSKFSFPWIRLQLEESSLVESVSLVLPGNGDNENLHYFEIRVGFHDISETGLDKPFSYNALCFKSGNETYPEGNTTFHCAQPLIGTFVSLQIVASPDVLEVHHNILCLCEVQVWGYPATVSVTDLSLNKTTTQSSTENEPVTTFVNDSAEASDATFEPAYFQSCTDDSTAVCSIDTSFLRTCTDILRKGCNQTGIYVLSYVNEASERVFFKAYCDMDTDGGGWTVLQRRNSALSDRENFTRGWAEYKEGFGNLCGEFWLGNDLMYYLDADILEMRMELVIGGDLLIVKYNYFFILDEENDYIVWARNERGIKGETVQTIDSKPFQTFDHHHPRTLKVDGGWWLDDADIPFNLNGERAMVVLVPSNTLHIVSKSEIKVRAKSK